jgi:hypothetical protein
MHEALHQRERRLAAQKQALAVSGAAIGVVLSPVAEAAIGVVLAANQDLLIRNEWQGVDVEELVRAQLAHFADLVGSRIDVDGPKLCLNAAAAQAIGLAVHELATTMPANTERSLRIGVA